MPKKAKKSPGGMYPAGTFLLDKTIGRGKRSEKRSHPLREGPDGLFVR